MLGEMEKAMLTRFCMGQQLHAILSLESIPPEASDLISKCDQIFKTDIQGTLSNNTLAFDASFNTEEEKMSWTQSDLVHLFKDEFALLERWWSTHSHNQVITICLLLAINSSAGRSLIN